MGEKWPGKWEKWQNWKDGPKMVRKWNFGPLAKIHFLGHFRPKGSVPGPRDPKVFYISGPNKHDNQRRKRILRISLRPEIGSRFGGQHQKLEEKGNSTVEFLKEKSHAQRARRGILMARGKNCRETIFAAQSPRYCPHHGVNFERGQNVLSCGGEAMWEAF